MTMQSLVGWSIARTFLARDNRKVCFLLTNGHTEAYFEITPDFSGQVWFNNIKNTTALEKSPVEKVSSTAWVPYEFESNKPGEKIIGEAGTFTITTGKGTVEFVVHKAADDNDSCPIRGDLFYFGGKPTYVEPIKFYDWRAYEDYMYDTGYIRVAGDF